MSARPIASGTISFGLVSIPIKLYAAADASAAISFNMLHGTDSSRLKQQYVCAKDGEIVSRDQMVKGYEFSKDRYVTFTPEELKALEEQSTQSIEVVEFVPITKIDPVYFDKPYYLEPQKGGERAYALMRDALAQSRKVGIGKVVLKSREHLSAVKSVGDMLTLQTMRFSHEIVDAGSLNLPKVSDVSKKEMDLANMLIDSMSDKFDPVKYKDDYYDKVLEIIQMKVAGVSPQAPAAKGPGPAKVVDLMEILKQSLSETKKGKGARTPVVEEETVVAGDNRATKPRKTSKAR